MNKNMPTIFTSRIRTTIGIVCFCGCLFISRHPLCAQPIDVGSLIRQEAFTCQDIAYSMTYLLPQYHKDNLPDTLDAMLSFWQDNCGGPEPMVRFRILYQIETNTFTDYWYPDNMLQLLRDYQAMVSENNDQPYYYDYFQGDYLAIHPEYGHFTSSLASHLQRYSDLQAIESFFLLFYSHAFDRAWEMLSSGMIEGTRIDSLYRAQEEQSRKTKRKYMGAYAGLWRPSGNLATIGNHLQIGGMIGSVQNRFVNNFNLMFGLFNAPDDYHVVVDNALYSTRAFFGIHLGYDMGYELARSDEVVIIPTIGIAAEGFEAFSSGDQETFGLSKMLATLNLNFGFEYRLLYAETNFLSLQAKYHIVGYRNEGGTDLSGNVFTFGAIIGFKR